MGELRTEAGSRHNHRDDCGATCQRRPSTEAVLDERPVAERDEVTLWLSLRNDWGKKLRAFGTLGDGGNLGDSRTSGAGKRPPVPVRLAGVWPGFVTLAFNQQPCLYGRRLRSIRW